MWKYVSVAEMVAIEKEADASGLTYELMMENAGSGLAEAIASEYSEVTNPGVLGLVGSGNNGGDTLVALAHLAKQGWKASAYIIRQRPNNDPLVKRLEQAGGNVYFMDNDPDLQVLVTQIKNHPIIMDGILGTGIHTGGLGAMHARNGDRLALYIRVGTDPDIFDTPIFHSQFNIPPAFAGNFTPVTLEAIFLYIYKPELLIYHAASPSSSSFKPSSPLPASDCSLP